MFTPNSYLMNVMADAHREDLLQEAAARRAVLNLQKEQKQMNRNDGVIDTTALTWRRRWQQLLVGAGLATALLLSGCQPITAPSAPAAQTAALSTAPVVTVTTSDYAFEAPTEINGGWVRLVQENVGQEPHHVQLARLNEGVTVEQFQAALQAGPNGALALVTLAGGPGVVDPQGHAEVTIYLEPGQYFLLCFVPDATGMPHLAHGMIAPLTVGEVVVAEEPVADAEVQLLDFSFILPPLLTAGEQTWKIVDEGEQPHEMMLIKLAAGTTMDDVQHWMMHPEGAPPFANVGGMQGIAHGAAAYLHLDLAPGNYVALCHIPDPASGKEHMELGMVMPFQVE
jgi:hypothetical protein